MNRPYRCAAMIYPVRFALKLFSPLKIRFIPRYSEKQSLLSNRAGLKRNAADGFFTKPSLFIKIVSEQKIGQEGLHNFDLLAESG
jgi:hypothetical protein